MRISRLILISTLATSAPIAALAHTGVDAGMHHGFVTGFMHPLTGLDHLAAMLAVGLWSALVARRAWPDLLWAPAGFAAMLLVGALAGLQGLEVPGVEPMIAASLLVMGLLVATRLQVPGPVAALLVGAFAAFHGLAHGYELAGEPGAALTLAGMLSATVLLHGVGIGLGWALRHAPRWTPQVTGGAVALLGLAMLTRLA
jgi:urease accessory protein